jgi:hypothetical protein
MQSTTRARSAKNMTGIRIFRPVIVAVAALALMAPAAQARPASQSVTPTTVRAHATQITARPAAPAGPHSGGFDWGAAAIGSGATLAAALIATAAVGARGRRRMPASA